MSGRSQVKVLEKPDDWWTWNAYITSLAETLWSARYTPGREALPRSADSTDPSIDSSYQQARSAPVEPQLALGRPQTTEPIRWIIKCYNPPPPPPKRPPAKTTEVGLALYTEEVSIYKEEKEQYRLDRLGLAFLDMDINSLNNIPSLFSQ